MKTKTLFAALVLFSGAVFAAETAPEKAALESVNRSFSYFSIGLGPCPVPLPNFALGYRKQCDHHGFDLSLQAATVVAITQIKINSLYHHFFKPNLDSQFYAGAGLGVSALVSSNHYERVRGLISPEFVVGKEYRNKTNDTRFIQAQISFPSCSTGRIGYCCSHHHRSDVFWMPLVVLSYGMGF
jgi:hypothetical protein